MLFFIDLLVPFKMKLLAHFILLLILNETYCQRSQLESLRPIYRFFRGLSHNLLRSQDESDAYKTNLAAGVSYCLIN